MRFDVVLVGKGATKSVRVTWPNGDTAFKLGEVDFKAMHDAVDGGATAAELVEAHGFAMARP